MGSPMYTALLEVMVPPLRAMAGAISRSALKGSRKVSCCAGDCCIALIALAVLAPWPLAAGAHETDQVTLPLGREFADLRVPVSRFVRDAIVAAVNKTNSAIKESLRDDRPTDRTARLQSADWIAGEVLVQLFATFPTNEALDNMLASPSMRARYPGLITVYRPEQFIYDDPLLLLDVTKLIRLLFRSPTINIDGTLLGTDKIIHFLHLGRIYHSSYLSARGRGVGEAEAISGAVQLSAGSNLFLSENGFLGILTTGIHSNGDLAANYAGFQFYRNLTETVRIGDKVLPPMLIREALYWKLDEHVRDEPDFFAAFVTPHWNEALNPNSYAIVTDTRVRKMLRSRCPDVLAWYRDEHGHPATREQFARIARDLSTFYGEDYGYQDDGKDTISIATTCFPVKQPDDPGAASAAAATGSSPAPDAPRLQLTLWQSPREPGAAHRAEGPAVDRLGRTRLWWAAKDGRLADVERLLAAGEDPNAADVDGEAPLHAAARWGHTAVVETLLAQGADPGMTALYAMTPLHVAVEESRSGATRALLKSGSDANARDMFGASPLHLAAAQGNRELATLLLAYGADPGAVDESATTPPQLAARSGNEALAKLLLLSATSPRAEHALGLAADGEARPPGDTAILHVSTDPGARRPGDTVTRAGAAAAPIGRE